MRRVVGCEVTLPSAITTTHLRVLPVTRRQHDITSLQTHSCLRQKDILVQHPVQPSGKAFEEIAGHVLNNNHWRAVTFKTGQQSFQGGHTSG